MPQRTGYSDAYRRRIERRLGMTIEAARDRGLSFQKARGHRRREHVVREERRVARGALTEAQRAFVRRQRKRSGVEVGEDDDIAAWELAYQLMGHAEREEIRLQQMRYAAGYARSRAPNRKGVNWMRSGRRGFVPDHLDMGKDDDIKDAPRELLFYH
jgi:hypothetical protein